MTLTLDGTTQNATFAANIIGEKLSLGTTDTDALIDVEGTGTRNERGIRITSNGKDGYSEIPGRDLRCL